MIDCKEKVKLLPDRPGVYIMKNEDGGIIYIGKAKILKNRVSQYFVGEHDVKTSQMVSHIRDFEFIVTATEMEALVLECSLIKHYKPKYNILLKDDKTYPYIKVELSEQYPRLTTTRTVDGNDKNLYFGPYSGQIKALVSSICKIFMLPTCNRKFPRDIGKERPCLHHHIGNCCGVCTGNVTPEAYMESVQKVICLLKGKYAQVEAELTTKMREDSENLHFEAAARIRDQLKALRLLTDRQKVVSGKNEAKDIIALYREQDKQSLSVLVIRDGRLIDSHSFITTPQDTEAGDFEQLIKQYYMDKSDIPKRIYISAELCDRELIAAWLGEKTGQIVRITLPRQGENYKLIKMAKENAAATLAAATTAAEKEHRVLLDLQSLLRLDRLPVLIEATDISNTGGDQIVGALVRFKNGNPDRSGYKKFKINSTAGQDDYGAHKELLFRRMTRFLDGDETFSPLPDLFLIDGGKGHVAAAKEILCALKINVPVFGMVKDDRHRVRGLTTEHEELSIPISSKSFYLIGAISEEVHRCAVTYHRQLRGKKAIHSRLLEIDGIGETRCKRLLSRFKTMESIKNATIEQLCDVKGMDKTAAAAVQRFFSGDGRD